MQTTFLRSWLSSVPKAKCPEGHRSAFQFTRLLFQTGATPPNQARVRHAMDTQLHNENLSVPSVQQRIRVCALVCLAVAPLTRQICCWSSMPRSFVCAARIAAASPRSSNDWRVSCSSYSHHGLGGGARLPPLATLPPAALADGRLAQKPGAPRRSSRGLRPRLGLGARPFSTGDDECLATEAPGLPWCRFAGERLRRRPPWPP